MSRRKSNIVDRIKVGLAGFLLIAMSLSLVQGLITMIIELSKG